MSPVLKLQYKIIKWHYSRAPTFRKRYGPGNWVGKLNSGSLKMVVFFMENIIICFGIEFFPTNKAALLNWLHFGRPNIPFMNVLLHSCHFSKLSFPRIFFFFVAFLSLVHIKIDCWVLTFDTLEQTDSNFSILLLPSQNIVGFWLKFYTYGMIGHLISWIIFVYCPCCALISNIYYSCA